jgi:glycosyltransferase involved in cell wall biosynthesis
MSLPLVAIVTPVYNGAEFLAEAMDSVQAQTWPNLVHIVIDNASTDDTPKILERYRNGRVPVVVLRNQTTLPIMANFNAAFDSAPAEAAYVRILCSDDTISPTCIEETVNLAETDPQIGVVGSLHYCFGAVQDFRWPADQTVFEGDEALRRILLGQGVLMPIQLTVRKSVADGRRPMFQPPLGGGFDMDAMMELLTQSKFGFIHKNLAFTRVHENAVSSTTYSPSTRSWTSDALHFLTSFGPRVFGPTYREHLLRFRRYYLRRILLWRREDDRPNLDRHYAALEAAGWRMGPGLVTDALLDWALIKLGIRRNWTGYPGWQ